MPCSLLHVKAMVNANRVPDCIFSTKCGFSAPDVKQDTRAVVGRKASTRAKMSCVQESGGMRVRGGDEGQHMLQGHIGRTGLDGER